MRRALAVANHVLVMLEGRVVLDGSPASLAEADIVAAYFGAKGGSLMEPLPFNEALYWTLIDIANALLTGTMIGGYYAMLAFGLALSFGVMRLVNLAHGEFLVVGASLSR